MATSNPSRRSVRFDGAHAVIDYNQRQGEARSRIPVSVQRSPPAQKQQHHWTCGSTKIPSKEEEKVDKSDPLKLAKAIFFQSLQNVLPSKLITSHVKLQGSLLTLEDDDQTTVDLSQYNKKYVVGFGKAVLPMAETLLPMMNGQIDRCIISVPLNSRVAQNPYIEVHTGAEHNRPDEDSYHAAQQIVGLVHSCTPDDLLIVLISGGASALLPFPIPPITLEEKQNFILTLSRAGCTAQELNTVRKRLSLVKAGGLVRMCRAKRIISLIISDVPGSHLSIIGGGPTTLPLEDPDEALRIVDKHNLEEEAPESILTVLKSAPLTPIDFEKFQKVTNLIIGDNQLALEDAAAAASKYGLHPFIITSQMHGEASEVGSDLGTLTEAVAYYLNYEQHPGDDVMTKPHLEAIKKVFRVNKWSTSGILPELTDENSRSTIGICLLFGGETIVKVRGTGTGGRNQELALAAGIRLDISRNLPWVKEKVAILSAATDGNDGPTQAAGAVIEGRTVFNSQMEGLSPTEFLRDNDSYHFFRQAAEGKYQIVTGHTETNVMDIAIIVILKKDQVKWNKHKLNSTVAK